MATLLIHSYSPGPSKGILLNPSPAPSPAYHPASLPALVPSNSSLSSSASSSAPGDASDYFSKSVSPSRGPSHSPPGPQNRLLYPQSRSRNSSNPSTVRRIRFAPLPEPRRDDDDLPPVFLDDDTDTHLPEQQLTMSSALAAASMSLVATTDTELSKRVQSAPASAASSPVLSRKCLPNDSLLLGCSHMSSDSSEPVPPDAHHATVSSECGQDWDVIPRQSPTLGTLSLAPESPRKPTKWSKMLKPLLGRSSNNKSHLTRAFSREELASMNGEAQRGRSTGPLGAVSSRDSSMSRERPQSDFGMPLHRWTSEGAPLAGLPLSKKKRYSLFGGSSSGTGVPLGRTQSLTSLSSNKDDRKNAKPVIVTNGGRKQQRMLNGRVYGAKRRNPNANPFDNVRTDEPEFVEWGYGGMGSVKTSVGQSSIWARVQAGDDAAGLARKSSIDDDDGTGMAWVKRRKEQREREKKEREEREKAEAKAKVAAEATVEVSEDVAGVEDKSEEMVEHFEIAEEKTVTAEMGENVQTNANVTVPSTPVTPAAADQSKSHAQLHIEHITQAVTIPAPSLHHRHHHSHSYSHSSTHHQHSHSVPHVDRRDSDETARAILAVDISSPTQDIPVVPPLVAEPVESEQESVSSSAASTASDGDVEESPKDTEGEFGSESDEEDEEEERSRLTALSAGVEKIARHHKEEQAKIAVGSPTEESS